MSYNVIIFITYFATGFQHRYIIMTSINLILRPSARQGRSQGSLALRLIHNRRAKTVTLSGCRLYPEEWDRQRQEVVFPENNPRRIAYLQRLENRIHHEVEILCRHLEMLQKQGYYDVGDLVSLYRQRKGTDQLSGYAETLARELERRGQERTARAYRTVVRGIVRFNKGVDIPLSQINNTLIKAFEKHLKEAGRLPNTISYYMRNLRAIYNKAVAGRRVAAREGNPFAGVYMGVTKTMKRALSVGEVKSLYGIDFMEMACGCTAGSRRREAVLNLYRAWRYFGFCLYARGMCFVDMAYLRKENIRGGVIRYVRKKTGQQIEVKVTPEMQSIIDSFSADVRHSSYVFPIIRDAGKSARLQYETALRMQNHRLKKLAAIAGTSRTLSTHWARHTWASIGKQNNLPVRVISECLGHTSEKTTRIYLDLLDNKLLDAANETVLSAIPKLPRRTALALRI